MEILIVFPLLAVLVAACWCLWGLFLGPVFGQEMLTLYYVRGDGRELENRVRSFGWFRDGKSGGRLLLVDCGLTAQGLELAQSLRKHYDWLDTCPHQALTDYLELLEDSI